MRLRALAERDVDELIAVHADPQTRRFSPAAPAYARAAAAAHVRGGSGAVVWGIELLDAPGRLAGLIELRAVHAHAGYVDVGYRTAAWARGRGVARGALSLVVGHGFRHGCHRVELLAAVDNTASRRVAERCGFHFEGIARDREYLHGRYRDLAVYSRLSTDS